MLINADGDMWDGRDFHGAKVALVIGDTIIAYKRDDIPSIPFPGARDLPGGGRENRESPIGCAIREVEEEFGLKIDPLAVQFSRAYPDSTHDGCSYFLVAELEAARLGEVAFGSEGERWTVMSIDEFLKHDGAVPHLQARLRDWLNLHA